MGHEKFSEKTRENEGKLIWVWKMKENLRGSGVDSSALVLIQWCFSVWYGVELAISLSLKILKRLG
jgi:hypothetical protein